MPLLAIPFPVIDPVALDLGPLQIRWYALAYLFGILIGWLWARRLVANDRLWGGVGRPTRDEIDEFILWATLGIVLGGRIGYVLFYNLPYYLENPLEIVQVWKGGMAFHGGLLGSIVAMVLFARKRGFSVWTLFDVFAASAPFGIFFGRIANFVNAELWGRTSDVPWAMVFPGAGDLPRHPSQLYQAALEGVVLFAILIWMTHRGHRLKQPGYVAGGFLAGYGIARFLVELVREPDPQLGYLVGVFTMGQLLSFPMIAIGFAAMAWAGRRAAANA